MSGAVRRPPVLWVGCPASPTRDSAAVSFLFDFQAGVSESEYGLRAIEGGGQVHLVAPRWRRIGDDFGQQLLNRPFAQLLLKARPGKVVVDLVCGATLDLIRLALLFGARVEHAAPLPEVLPEPGTRAHAWVERILAEAGCTTRTPVENPLSQVQCGYEAYAFGQRDHALLYRMQAPLAAHFSGCRLVLDVGCGTGLFLEVLARAGIESLGVERNPLSARYAAGLGHRVVEQGAFEFLETTRERFDGVYCSHFVEHLPTEAVERLIALLAGVLQPGGVALLVFPDPESIRSQLLGFWRDPEHVRFYHPDLIALIGSIHGLECEFHSQRVPGRRVVSFELEPPLPPRVPTPIPAEAPVSAAGGVWDRILNCCGLAAGVRLKALENAVDRLQSQLRLAEQQLDAQDAVLRRLWEVNQTWAWEDNAVLRLRKTGTTASE